MGEPGPRKTIHLLDVVEKLDQLVGAGTNFLHLGALIDGVEIVAHVVDAATRRPYDVIESGEIAHEQGLGSSTFGVEPAIGHRLSTTGLVARIHNLVAEALEQFEGRDADFWKERIDVTGNEKADSHVSLH